MSDDWEIELKSGFLEEASQAISENEKNFLDLEKDPTNSDLVDSIFRLAHNLKGSAKAVGFSELGAFTHEFESILLKIRTKELAPSQNVVNLLLRCNDHVRSFVDALKADHSSTVDSSQLIQEIQATLAGSAEPAPQMDEEIFEAPTAEEVAMLGQEIQAEPELTTAAVSLLEAAFEKAAEIPIANPQEVSASVSAQAPVAMPKAASQKSVETKKENKTAGSKPDESIRVSLSRIEMLLNYVGELVILEDVLKQQVSATHSPELRKTVHQVNKVTKEIQSLSMSLRMIPLQNTFQKMQRIVRDTASLLNKEVALEIIGEGTEVDKSVLESLSDPLVHCVRNAVDHGIESAEKRIAAGKNPVGKVRLEAFHRAGQLYIEVEDDGGGIDPQKIRTKAIEKGVLRGTEKLSDQDAVNLVFHPGFSTKQEVSEVSGRGVGMDVVKTNIENLGGSVTINSVVHRGSIFQIRLPLTLAIADALVVMFNGQRFVVPLSQVHESVRVGEKDIHQGVHGDALLFRNENLPLFRLGKLLGQPHNLDLQKNPIALVFQDGGRSFAVLVDDIIGQQPIVMKELSQGMAFSKGFSGITILGDGKPALILELADLAPMRGVA